MIFNVFNNNGLIKRIIKWGKLNRSIAARVLFACIVTYAFIPTAPAATGPSSTINFTPEERAFIQANPVIVVGGEKDWPPFDFVENGEYTGAAKDYLLVLEKYTGLKFHVQTGYTWAEMLERLKNKQFDMIPMIFWNKPRTAFVNFTDPYLVIRQYVFVNDDSTGIKSMEDLYGMTLAIQEGFAQIAILNEYHPEIKILEVADTLAAIDAVVIGQADGLIENTAIINYLTKKNNIKGLKPIFPTDLGIHNIHMGIRKDWPILRDIIQKGLNSISESEHTQIAQKWISFGDSGSNTQPSRQKIELTDDEKNYLSSKGILKACVDPDWMPLERIENGQYIGMGADYLDIFRQKINLPIKVVPTKSWAESLERARARNCDIFVLSSDTPKRREFMNISSPYVKVPVVIATKPDISFISDISDLHNKSIGIVDGYALAETINENEKLINFRKVASRDEGLQMVADGRLFGFIDAVTSIDHEIINNYYGEIKIGGKFGIDWDLGVATRNDEPLLGHIFEKVVTQIPAHTKQSISQRWGRIDYIKKFDYELLWKIIGVFSVITIAIFVHNRQLAAHRKEVHKKNLDLKIINAKLEEQKTEIQHLADHDFLTNLPNKKKFLEHLNHAISIANRQNRMLAVLFLDLDRFKNINDSLGHEVGDELLKVISDRLLNLLRESDVVARVGGDEFLILIEEINDVEYPSIVAQRVLGTLREPTKLRDTTLTFSASIGIALYPQDGDTAEILIKNADSAMYLAKDKGKNDYQYYTHQLSEQISRRLQIEQALKDAVKNHELSLCYQPQIDLKTEEIVGAEALVRWQHPELGFISPVEFIPIAEDSGLILGIGEWVFRKACEAFVSWREADLTINNISINVSSVQFTQSNLPTVFNAIVADLGMKPQNVEIEITERYIMDHTENNMSVLNELRDLGFVISVDDFGTGYSSMGYLKTLPLDIIKIDKSFISDIPEDNNDVQITKAILALSHSLGYRVIAEGIETAQQLEMLQEFSCDIGQGYYFSKPICSDEFMALLATDKTNTNVM